MVVVISVTLLINQYQFLWKISHLCDILRLLCEQQPEDRGSRIEDLSTPAEQSVVMTFKSWSFLRIEEVTGVTSPLTTGRSRHARVRFPSSGFVGRPSTNGWPPFTSAF